MSAPINDNFLNYTLITGGGGIITGSNINATSQVNEPANNGCTVWYLWQSPKNTITTFSTIYDKSIGTSSFPPCQTVLQAFNSASTFIGLTEVDYLNSSFKQNFASWEDGSQITFNTPSGSKFFIRIDGRITNGLISSSIVNGGTGYGNGDILFPSNGDGIVSQLQVTSNTTGSITGLTASYSGSYIVVPNRINNNIRTNTGTGSGAVCNFIFDNITSQGNFKMFWGQYWPNNDSGPCTTGSCPTVAGDCFYCVGTITPDTTSTASAGGYFGADSGSPTPNVTPIQGQVYSFGGNLPRGLYFLKWCEGAYGTPDWTVFQTWENNFGNLAEGFIVSYYDNADNGVQKYDYILPKNSADNISGNDATTFLDAEYNMYDSLLNLSTPPFEYLSCCGKFLNHGSGSSSGSGSGDISIFLIDPIFNDNSPNPIGQPEPTFGLYHLLSLPDIKQSGSSACATWDTIGSTANCVFNIYNNSSFPAANATITLLSSGGITGGSTQTNITLNSNTTTPVSFSFNCSSSNVIATLNLSIPGGTCSGSTDTLQFYLNPLISPNTQGGVTGPSVRVYCTTDAISPFTVNNAGYWNIQTASVTMTFDSPIVVFTGQDFTNHVCTSQTASVINIQLPCATTTTLFFPETTVITQTGGVNANLYINILDDQGNNIFSNTYPYHFP